MTATAPAPSVASTPTAAPRAVESAVELGPVLARVGGLPVTAVDALAGSVQGRLERLSELDERLDAFAPAVVDTLFALVPSLDDDVRLRRAVLAGKRCAHKRDPLPWDDGVLASVLDRLEPLAAQAVQEYHDACRLRCEELERLADAVAADRDRAVSALYDLLDDDDYHDALAVAAPDWLRYARPRRRRSTSPVALKTVVAYAIRSALKTSPFSGLTTVAAAGNPGQGRRTSAAATMLAVRALHSLARDERTAARLLYRPAPLRPGGAQEGAGLVLRGETVLADGIYWRSDRVLAADHARRWLDLLGEPDAGTPGLRHDQVLDRLGGADPAARFRRVLDAGLLAPVVPWRRGQAPLVELAAVAGPADSPIRADDLLEVHQLGEGLARLDADARVAAAGRLADLTAGWGAPGDLGVQTPSGLIYEDRESDLDLSDPRQLDQPRRDLEALAARVRPFVFRSHLYDVLVETFVERYGVGGTSTDPLGFLMRLSVEQDANVPVLRAQGADIRQRRCVGERAWLPVGPTSAAPSAGVLWQLAVHDPGADAVAAGRYDLVVNHFSSGSGALSARFRSLLGEPFAEQLRDYVRDGYPDGRCRELLLWTECNNAQAHCAGLLPPLVLPGEPGADGGLALVDCALQHDPTTDTLALLDPTGEPVGLAYLGLTPQHLLHGYQRLLATLANPWINAAAESDYTPVMTELADLCDHEIRHLPRRQVGRLVTRRASWVVPVTELPRAEHGGTDAGVLRRLHELRSRHGMPAEVFVHQLGAGPAALFADHKPTWLSFGSALSVDTFWQWLDPGTTHVRVVEALPARGQQLVHDDDGRARVSEYASFLRWHRPEVRS